MDDISANSDEPGFPVDEIGTVAALRIWEGNVRSIGAIEVERYRTPEAHPPYFRIGRRILYSRRLYELWRNSHLVIGGKPVTEFDADSVNLTAEQRQALAEYLARVAKARARHARAERLTRGADQRVEAAE